MHACPALTPAPPLARGKRALLLLQFGALGCVGCAQPRWWWLAPARSRALDALQSSVRRADGRPGAMQDCNFVMYDNTLPARGPSYYDAVYATGTSGRSALGGLDAGCQVYIQDGLFRIVDSRGNTIFNTYGSVNPVADTLNYGSSLHQGQSLYSQNGLYYLELQVRGVPPDPSTGAVPVRCFQNRLLFACCLRQVWLIVLVLACLQPDGNIVTRTAQGNNLVFSANSYQSNPTSLFPITLAVQSVRPLRLS